MTVFEGVPTMYVALLARPDRADYDDSALRRTGKIVKQEIVLPTEPAVR